MSTPEIPLRIDTQQEAMKLRFEEFHAVYDNTTALSERRQSINNLFVGINTLFLTAFGYLFITLTLQPWWPSVIFAILTIPVTAINMIWYRLNHRYKNLVNVRILYLKALEQYLHKSGFDPITIALPRKKGAEAKAITLVGVHNFEDDATGELRKRIGPIYGFSSLEQGIIQVFLFSYIGITTFVIILNALNAFYGVGTGFPAVR